MRDKRAERLHRHELKRAAKRKAKRLQTAAFGRSNVKREMARIAPMSDFLSIPLLARFFRWERERSKPARGTSPRAK